MFKQIVFAACLSVLATASHAVTAYPLGQNAAMTGGEYTTGGGITVAMEAREIGGKLGLCGVWAQSRRMSAYTSNAASRVLAKGVARLNGEVVATDFRFLNRVLPAASYAGAPATCVVLNRPWQAFYRQAPLQLRIPKQKIFTAPAGSRRAPRVFFTQSENPNPALSRGSIFR